MAQQTDETRMKRGHELLQSVHISQNADGSFSVPSITRKDTVYEVRLLGEQYVCTCPDFEYRFDVQFCKHIHAVKCWIGIQYTKNEAKPRVFSEDAVQCDRCGSIRTMKWGTYGTKQMFYCKDCKHKFRESSLLKKAKFSPELVTLTLDLYFSGLSVRKIARNVSDHMGVDIHPSTIYSWLKKYIPIISQYVNSLVPKELSKTWHADEIFVKLKGGEFHKSGARIGFVWNIMDRETRFLLASKLSDERDKANAIIAFKEAIAHAKGILPEKVHTDSLNSYNHAIKMTMPSVEHVANCGLKKRHANNNRIERLNGTIRERVKVQRGWKTKTTVLAEGQRIHYNFVKPHASLNCKTPAQAAKIETSKASLDAWMNLLKPAMEQKSSKNRL